MAGRLDEARRTVAAGGVEWPFRLDLQRGTAIVETGAGERRVRPQRWAEKRRLAQFAGWGEEFVREQLWNMCVRPGSPPASEDERDAVLELVVWMSCGGRVREALPYDRRQLDLATFVSCRALGIAPNQLDSLPAYEVEALWRCSQQNGPADLPLATPSSDEFSHQILIVPDTIAPEITPPETIAPERIAPETIAPETTAPETTAPEMAVPVGAARTGWFDDSPASRDVFAGIAETAPSAPEQLRHVPPAPQRKRRPAFAQVRTATGAHQRILPHRDPRPSTVGSDTAARPAPVAQPPVAGAEGTQSRRPQGVFTPGASAAPPETSMASHADAGRPEFSHPHYAGSESHKSPSAVADAQTLEFSNKPVVDALQHQARADHSGSGDTAQPAFATAFKQSLSNAKNGFPAIAPDPHPDFFFLRSAPQYGQRAAFHAVSGETPHSTAAAAPEPPAGIPFQAFADEFADRLQAAAGEMGILENI